jgi:hypothetical protein
MSSAGHVVGGEGSCPTSEPGPESPTQSNRARPFGQPLRRIPTLDQLQDIYNDDSDADAELDFSAQPEYSSNYSSNNKNGEETYDEYRHTTDDIDRTKRNNNDNDADDEQCDSSDEDEGTLFDPGEFTLFSLPPSLLVRPGVGPADEQVTSKGEGECAWGRQAPRTSNITIPTRLQRKQVDMGLEVLGGLHVKHHQKQQQRLKLQQQERDFFQRKHLACDSGCLFPLPFAFDDESEEVKHAEEEEEGREVECEDSDVYCGEPMHPCMPRIDSNSSVEAYFSAPSSLSLSLNEVVPGLRSQPIGIPTKRDRGKPSAGEREQQRFTSLIADSMPMSAANALRVPASMRDPLEPHCIFMGEFEL